MSSNDSLLISFICLLLFSLACGTYQAIRITLLKNALHARNNQPLPIYTLRTPADQYILTNEPPPYIAVPTISVTPATPAVIYHHNPRDQNEPLEDIVFS